MADLGVVHVLSRFIPELRTKGKLRLWYYALTGKINRHHGTGERLPFTIDYQPLTAQYRLRFDSGRFAGEELLFPPLRNFAANPCQATAPWAFLWGVGQEVESYFTGPALERGDLVIDAGGCPGDYCLLAERAIGEDGCVVALEADTYSAGYLGEVVRRNEDSRCHVLHAALADRSGKVELVDDEYGTRLVPAADGAAGDAIDAITFDDLVETYDPEMKRRHVLKMDIEGAELAVVPSVLAGKHTPDVFAIAAYHPDRESGKASHHILAPMLADAGYHCALGEHEHTVLFAWR